MALESDLRARVAKLLRDSGYMTQSIETGSIGDGVPDLWYSKKCGIVTHAGWIELKKVREMPKRPGTAVFKSLNHPLSVEQENWIDKAREHGTCVWILVGYGREYFMVPSNQAENFNSFTEATLRLYGVSKSDIPNILLINNC